MVSHNVERVVGLEPLVNGGCFATVDLRVRVPSHHPIHVLVQHRQVSPVHFVEPGQFFGQNGQFDFVCFAIRQRSDDFVDVAQVDVTVITVRVAQYLTLLRPVFSQEVVVISYSPV
jgi:hypothetical protein